MRHTRHTPAVQRREFLWGGGLLTVVASFTIAVFGAPTPTRLHDVFVVNRRDEPVDVQFELGADGTTYIDRTLELDAGDRVHLGCTWPPVALSYGASVRPDGADAAETIRWDDYGRICKKIAIEDDSVDRDVAFYASYPCPTNRPENSCG
jgi:hypothetical protein